MGKFMDQVRAMDTISTSGASPGDFVDIGDECFASQDMSVISFKGENYYKMCGKFVSRLGDGGASHCVKRSEHPGNIHEDYEGRTKDDWNFNFGVLSLENAVYQAIGAASGCWENMFGAGEFQSDRAKAIGEQLMARIKQGGVDND